MPGKIKNRIEKELTSFIHGLDKRYSLSKLSPLLFKNIKAFVTRKGKRVRPILFVAGYLGFAKKPALNLYQTALSFELLHDFFLVHDDIVDKSATRRGKPSMHKMLGQDLAIIAGDVLYALAIDAFLSIKEKIGRRERALRKFINAAVYTATGEFIELLSGAKDIARISKQDIYKIYDYKTASYTFASPLCCGALLAGAGQNEINKLHRYGIYLGRAFQIKDDILGMFGQERKTGKSALSDLQEAKKTLLVFYAYKNSSQQNRLIIKRILSKDKIKIADLLKMRKIIRASGALTYAAKEISALIKKAQSILQSSRLRLKYKNLLRNYSQKLLSV